MRKKKIYEAFQTGSWESKGWAKAKEVVLSVGELGSTIDAEEKIRLITLTMEAATESKDWLELLVAVTQEFVRY